MESIWDKTITLSEFPALKGDLSADVAVIGGGLAGILSAYCLQQRNLKTVVLEADKIGSGQSGKTTAKITSQHNLIYTRLVKNFGEEKARQYAQANQQAIAQYRKIIAENGVDCDFEQNSSYLYSAGQQDSAKLEKEAYHANKLGIQSEMVAKTTLPFSVAGALKFYDQAEFHPLKFLKAISKDLTIYENTAVKNVVDHQVLTDNGTVTAKYVVFATHFPFLNAPGFYFSRMHQERSYVLALEGIPKLDGMYLGIGEETLSLRSFGQLLLLGGGNHRTGENSAGGKYLFLREKAEQYYPNHKIIANWSAQDCMTLDGVPYIGQFSPSTPNWYVATGFGKWGMTGSMVSAMLIADKITGVDNPCAEIFSPLRFSPSPNAMKVLISDVGQAVKGIARQTFFVPEKNTKALVPGHGGVVEYAGEKIGIYKDEQGKLYGVSTRCPHLGCQLEWNPDEKSWDCPCHGSRFDYRGNLIDNPAQKNLEAVQT